MALTSVASAAITANSGQAYVDECVAAGVPLPPPWNYEQAWHGVNSAWIRVPGTLDITLVGAKDDGSGNPIYTEVFYYDSGSPNGKCVALPRGVFAPNTTPDDGPPTYVQLMGVICQGFDTGKACFWDSGSNYIPGGLPPTRTLKFGDGTFESDDESVDPVDVFAGGVDLNDRDQCTQCHKGENVFIIHPATVLGQASSGMPSVWMDPIVKSGWPENEPPRDPLGGGACSTCHRAAGAGRFPTVSNQTLRYCNRILQGTFGVTMPANGPLPFLDPPNGPTQAELEANYPEYYALLDECASPPPDAASPSKFMMSMDGPAEQY